MLSSLLSSGNQKQVVGIALTPGIGLEAAVLNKSMNVVENYGRKKVDYNFSTREINDSGQFKTALSALMDEMKIPRGTPAYLVLPNVFFDFLEIPSTISDAEIKMTILSQAEDFYLFKKEEPASGWCEVANVSGSSQKRIAYSSIQKRVVDELKEILVDVGLQVAGIEGAFGATLRGLHLSGAIDDVVLEDATWTAMIINMNSYTLFNFEGKNLLDYNEVPLAIKSFSTEEAYAAIVSSSSQLLSNFSSNKLFMISQTDEICTKILKRQMQFDGEMTAIDTNKYSERPVMEVLSALDFNDANSMTLTVLGAANIKSNFGLIMNILADEAAANMGVYFTTNAFGAPLEVTKETVTKICSALIVLFLMVFVSISGVAYFISSSNDAKASKLQNQINNLDTQIQAESQVEKVEEAPVEEVDMNAIIDEIAASNVSAINFYDSIASDIPKNVWLTKYYNKSGTKLAVQGIAENIADIYEYYKNLRIVSPQSDIKLTELKVVTEDLNSEENKYLANLAIDKDLDRLYSFEISNTQIEYGGPKKEGEEEKPRNDAEVIPRTNVDVPSEQMEPTGDEE